MNKAIIQIKREDDDLAAIAAMGERFVATWKGSGNQDPVAILSFSSPAQLFCVISPKRWELIEALQKTGPSSIRGLARVVNRDIKRVHDDVCVLIEWSIIEKNTDDKVFVPYDEIEADFTLKAVA